MPASPRLGSEDRTFLSRVAKIIFTNPFSDERAEVEALTSSGPSEAGDRYKHYLSAIVPALNERIELLERSGLSTVQGLKGDDRTLLQYAFLLQVYHRFVNELDELIQLQLRAGSAPTQAPFAQKLLAQLQRRGFSEQEAARYLALFYQLRRAYYFIGHLLIGDSPSMKQLRLALWNNVFTHDVRTYDQHLWNRMEDFSTLLLGETGTGKGSAAAAIGRSGYIPFDRKQGCFAHSFTETFVAINLSQFPESLIESELFGHRKGAFTGAVGDHNGLFERCSAHGALFLDEIGDVTVPVQIKLLQVLQERTFTPVGSHSQQRFGGRVIAATNRSIPELRNQGNFRDDFFYRLSSDVIIVPPLRQRIEESPSELEQLVNLLVARMTGEESPKLTDVILDTLRRDLPPDYPWRGNVRELEQAVRRILLTQHYTGDLMAPSPNLEEELLQIIQTGTLQARDLVSHYCTLLHQRFGTYEEVARRTGLDRRTVKKYLQKTARSTEDQLNGENPIA